MTTAAVAALAASMAALAALASFATALVSLRFERGRKEADTLLRVAEIMQNEEMRLYKQVIYGLDRDDHGSWSPEEKKSVQRWCGKMDVVAALINSGHVSVSDFFMIWGDVTVRAVYQIAPFAVHETNDRGDQYLLPLRQLTSGLEAAWNGARKSHGYPDAIMVPAPRRAVLNWHAFSQDTSVARFRKD